ncbi:MAG TPA: cytochrome c biogenesis protein ResB [Nitrospiraceae bacterium]|jgi:cytochrome c biogenesis protein|nr:cytochrome c biogenesis protein ResB [Nitrospiraceae bacterium]
MNGKPEVISEREAARPSTPGLGWEEFSRELVEFFASIKLAMFLFIALAMTATIGTVVQQGERPEVYIQEYGEEAYRWFVRLGFTDVYHTWWFTGLLGLLCVNSLTCFYKRFPAVWRSMRQDKVNVSLAFIRNMKQRAEIPVAAPQEQVAERMAEILIEKGYRVLAKHEPGEVTLYATKGVMGRVGAHMAHLSATVIVLGGLIGSYYGFQEFGVCLEGQTYHIPRGNFDLKVDKFWIDYYENGAIKSYNSTLTVIDQGVPVTTKTITVNDPLVYKGIWFYQSSYGDAWDRIEVARINVKDKATDKVLKTVDLEWQKETSVDGLDLKVTLTDFVADFAFNSTEKKVFSKTIEHANPAVRLAIKERKTLEATPWIFYHYPDLFEIQGSKYAFELVGYQPKKFTGLQIAKNPGVNIVWVGSTMIVVGITLSSFIYHRRLWAKVIPEPNGVTVHLGGTTHKSQIDFQKEFAKLTQRIKTLDA